MLATAQLISIPYCTHSESWFFTIRHLSHAVWLDSGNPLSDYGRFDILSAAPSVTLETYGENTIITDADGTTHSSSDSPFLLLQQQLATTATLTEIPFSGGALGYFAYDLGRRLEKLPKIASSDINLPDMCVGIYPWAIIQDHHKQTAWLVINKHLAPSYNFSDIKHIIQNHAFDNESKQTKTFFTISKFKINLDIKCYLAALKKIHNYINSGDCYQVNYSQRFSAKFTGDPLIAHLKLRATLPSPFSAFLQLKQGAIISLSPERFVKVKDNLVESKPIKGTIPRGKTLTEDQANADILFTSEKDRAENLMIVDLLRNDLSKSCSEVKVTELFSLQSFTNVHHLVSTITAKLKHQTSVIELLASCFPGGSITGAPKIRAMEIIEELEPTRRSIYCGSIGYISSCGNMDTNIAIRTLVCEGENIYCWGGGGIVADSIAEKEYEESLAKVKVLMDTLEHSFSKKY